MTNLKIPISLPTGIELGDNADAITFTISRNKLLGLGKTPEKTITFHFKIEPGHPDLSQFESVDHCGIQIPGKVIRQYAARISEEEKVKYTAVIEIEESVEELAKDFSARGDIEKEIIFGLAIYLQAVTNIFGLARFSPFILVDDKELQFNAKLAYLINPWQEWFRDLNLIQIILNEQAYEAIKSKTKYYDVLRPHLLSSLTPLSWSDVRSFSASEYVNDDSVFAYGRILSELVRQHPGTDYSSMVGSLTSFIEGLLKIDQEHGYKFRIKISNLLDDPTLVPALKVIYNSRSKFFHTGVYKDPNDIFEFANLEFLFFVIRRLYAAHFTKGIEPDSFDFKSDV